MFIDIHVHTRLADYLLELKTSGEISEVVFNKIAQDNASCILGL